MFVRNDNNAIDLDYNYFTIIDVRNNNNISSLITVVMSEIVCVCVCFITVIITMRFRRSI